MNAPVFLGQPRTRVLRVFGGRLDGAEYRLPPGRSLRLGHALDNDVVLRGAGTKGCRFELRAGEDALSVTLVSGEAHLLGHKLAPGQPILLPPFVPLAVGEFGFAVGPQDAERWPEAEALAGQLALMDAPLPVAVRPQLVELARQRAASLSHYAPRWLRHPATMLGGALALFAVLAVGPIRDYATRDIRDAETARMALAAGGFSGIVVAQDPAGEALVFTGSVADDDELAELRALVADDFPGARLDVDTSAALASAASDILAAEGVDAEARASGLGIITVSSEYLPADRQRELTDRLKADLPGLKRARFVLTGERGPGDLAYFLNSSRYGLATFVDGEPGYLVTADGSYWFEGAMLPTGHEILSARAGRITLERNGLVEEILLGPATPFVPVAGARTASNPNHPSRGEYR